MSKFKVGDIVRRVRGCYGGIQIGDIGTIIKITSNGIDLKESLHAGCHDDRNFKLVEKTKEVKNETVEFKIGDVVEVLEGGASGSYWNKGESFRVLKVGGNFCRGRKSQKNWTQDVNFKYLKKVEEVRNDMVNLPIGTRVQVVRQKKGLVEIGTTGTVTSKDAWRTDDGDDVCSLLPDYYTLKVIEYVSINNKTKGVEMKKVISDNFVKTGNALVVEKYLGCQITDNFIGGLVVKQNKIAILDEARRLEKEELAKK